MIMPIHLFVTIAVMFAPMVDGHPRPTAAQAYQLGEWRLVVAQDLFTRRMRCSLSNRYGHNPDLIAGPHALLVRLPGRRDGAGAWFSVDRQPAKPWRDVEAVLIEKGALADVEALGSGLD